MGYSAWDCAPCQGVLSPSKPPAKSDKSAEYCTKCNKSGHSNTGCFDLHPELLAEYRAKRPLRERGRGKKGKKAEAHAVMPGDEELNIADLFCITDATAPVASRYEYTFGTYQVFDGVDMCCATDIDIHEVATAVPAPYTTVFPTILANPAPTVDMLDDMEGMPIHEFASVCPDWSVIEQSVYQQQQFSFEPLLIYRERDLCKTDIRVESVPTEECFVVTSVDPAVEANVPQLLRPASAAVLIPDQGYKEPSSVVIVCGSEVEASLATPVYDVSRYELTSSAVTARFTAGNTAVAMDSGAARSLCRNIQLMQDVVTYTSNAPQIRVASGTVVSATGVGVMVLFVRAMQTSTGEYSIITLKFPNTLYIPTLHLNLVAGGTITYFG